MRQLNLAIAMIVVGAIMLVIALARAQANKDGGELRRPYLRNAAVVFIIIGLYYLIRNYV